MRLVATTPKGTERLVADELRGPDVGAVQVEERPAAVTFEGALETAYRACLWSRVASRVLLPIARFPAPDEAALYAGARAIAWSEHLAVDGTLAVDFTQVRSAITHTRFGAQKTKDAIVDRLRDEHGRRPSVDTARPDVRVHVHVEDDVAEVAIDLSGEALHRRSGARGDVPAPLKENLAAALLLLAGWPEAARAGRPLVDPMCGSGTILAEAAAIAGDAAPGLGRSRFGFHGWRQHDAALWRRLVEEARARRHAPAAPLYGFDADARAVAAARARLGKLAKVEQRALAELAPPDGPAGLVVTNPPYGERLDADEALYRELGDVLRRRMMGWTAFVLTANAELAKQIGLRARRKHVLWNGALECRLLELPISTEPVREEGPAWRRRAEQPTPGAEAFTNRLSKNWKHWRRWAEREGISCFRVYDADLPEYAVAVDVYDGAAHVQEYAPPSTIEPARAEARLRDVVRAVPAVLGVAPEDVFVKQRRRQRPETQYGRVSTARAERVMREGGHRFLVNLSDYVDTGLYLDHRRLRQMVGELARGRRFLNLFAYTGSATVYAARGGARSTVSVDLSNTYLAWARRNLELNDVAGGAHELVRGDVLAWLPSETRRFGLILMTPPTFSNSKSMTATLDVQRDHVALLGAAARLLEPDGVLLFSNHFRRFKLDAAALPELAIESITDETLPKDFARSPRVHNAWRVTRRR